MYNRVIKLDDGASEWVLVAGDTSIPDNNIDGKALGAAAWSDSILDLDVVLDGVNRVKFPEGGERFYTVDTSGFLRMYHIHNGPVIAKFQSTS